MRSGTAPSGGALPEVRRRACACRAADVSAPAEEAWPRSAAAEKHDMGMSERERGRERVRQPDRNKRFVRGLDCKRYDDGGAMTESGTVRHTPHSVPLLFRGDTAIRGIIC